MSVNHRLIVPLDVASPAAALALVDQLPQVGFWKVGLELFIRSGPLVIQELKARQKRIFLDLKLHDIPNTMAGACAAATSYGVDLLTLHATAGTAALEAARWAAQAEAEQAHLPLPVLVGVTLLTSMAPPDLARELQVPLSVGEYTLHLAHLAQTAGLGGVVCSPQEVALLRQVMPPEFVLVCPGVRPAWAQANDQRRTLTPLEALRAGATYLVIGRPILTSADPVGVFDRICEECSGLAD
ncbi:MAG: orotidine-5'-phosphate decarboxylase [Nodosilinea sp.]